MKQRRIFQIAALANDVSRDGRTLGEGTKTRCDYALVLIRDWLQQTAEESPAPSVIVYNAAGKGGRWRGETTFASAMEEYIRVSLGVQALRCVFVTNRNNDKVWSTLHEMGWIFHEINWQSKAMLSGTTIYEPARFVTNSTHAQRVHFIQRHFYKDESMGDCVLSNEVPPPWWHEWFGYIKLLLCRIGLGSLLEPLRRRCYKR